LIALDLELPVIRAFLFSVRASRLTEQKGATAMKISAKTLQAARRAAKARGMSLDSWAEKVLAEAAATSDQPSKIEVQLREISEKIDRVADRQRLGERASEQLAGAVDEMGASFKRAREGTGQALSEAESRASSAAEQMTARARELIEGASKSASELFGTLMSRTEPESETDAKRSTVKPSRAQRQSRASRGTKSAGAARRQPTSNRKPESNKPRGSQRRRSQPKSKI
jgi:hypothetical protein